MVKRGKILGLIEENKGIISELPQKIRLDDYYHKFKYPIPMTVTNFIGQIGWQQNKLSILDVFYLWFQKMYNNILHSEVNQREQIKNLIFDFLMQDREKFEARISDLILKAKDWTSKKINDQIFASYLEEFCKIQRGIQIKTLSFILRVLFPLKFATIDVRVTQALKKLGFKIKVLEFDSFESYSGIEYLEYIELLSEIGKKFTLIYQGTSREMYPSEVDMALYIYDKESLESGTDIKKSRFKFDSKAFIVEVEDISDISDLKKKYTDQLVIGIELNLLKIVEEDFFKDPRPTRDEKKQMRKSINTLRQKIHNFKYKSDFEGLYEYIVRLSSQRSLQYFGVQARKILEHYDYPTIELLKRKYIDRFYKQYHQAIKKFVEK